MTPVPVLDGSAEPGPYVSPSPSKDKWASIPRTIWVKQQKTQFTTFARNSVAAISAKHVFCVSVNRGLVAEWAFNISWWGTVSSWFMRNASLKETKQGSHVRNRLNLWYLYPLEKFNYLSIPLYITINFERFIQCQKTCKMYSWGKHDVKFSAF